jgi:hypothetical protein
MAREKFVIAVYSEDTNEILAGFEKLKGELEDQIGMKVRKQDVWIKIIQTGMKVLKQQPLN